MHNALLGHNLDEDGFQAMACQSAGHGAATAGIGDPGKSPVLRLDIDGIKKHIKKWMEGPKENNSFKGINSLERAADDGLLRPGQLIFGTVSIKHHEGADGFRGWLYDSFSSLISKITTNQMRPFAYLHVAIYAGKVGGVHYTIENGGYDDPETGIGAIAARSIDDAFKEEDVDFFVVSPPKDKSGRSTRYIVLQRALASIGVTYEYHMRAISCETFCTAILHPSDDSFRPIQRSIVRSHKKNLSQENAERKLDEDTENYKRFHNKLCHQISLVPPDILLSLKFHLNERQNQQGGWWIDKMVRSYQEFRQACKSDRVSACQYLDRGLLVEAETLNKILLEVASKGDSLLVNKLISYGANIDKILIEAARKGDSLLVNKLISYGANIEHKDKLGRTALILASEHGHIDTVTILIQHGADINCKTSNGYTALMWAAASGHTHIVTLLIQQGADIHCKDTLGFTALMWAAASGHTHIVTLLLKLGADIHCKNTSGKTALSIAQNNHHTHIVDIINGYAVKKE